ncbi:MAG: substrate-binding domain-containing protein [Ferruginibacter sp.]
MVKRVSLKDIAKEVGVSSALVSYVLNEKKTGRIDKIVAQTIRDTARRLNYRTNQIARSLKTNRTNTIGFIVADISNPFSSSLARIVEDEAAKNNYTVLFGSSDENALKFQNLVEIFLNRHVDGLMLAPGEHAEAQIRYLQQQEIPFVLIDRYFPDIQTNYVILDNFQAAHTAVSHLVNCGYKKIGMIGYQSSIYTLKERTRGYLSALESLTGVMGNALLREVQIDDVEANINEVIDELLAVDEPVDAILFASNEIALHGLIYLNELKIKVPEQLAIITFDGLASWDLFYAPLTYIRQPLQEMGELATKILLENIENTKQLQQFNLPGSLIVRAST